MESAEVRLHATGMFRTNAIRRSALTSGSCGCGCSGSPKKMTWSTVPSAMRAPTCWSSPRGPLLSLMRGLQLLLEQCSRCPGGQQLMVGQQFTVVLRPFEQVRLLVFVGDERAALPRGHWGNGSIHVVTFLRGRKLSSHPHESARAMCVRRKRPRIGEATHAQPAGARRLRELPGFAGEARRFARDYGASP
jgi:hypothetical protein